MELCPPAVGFVMLHVKKKRVPAKDQEKWFGSSKARGTCNGNLYSQQHQEQGASIEKNIVIDNDTTTIAKVRNEVKHHRKV